MRACSGRDAYGFAVRPQHVQRYREYANIYKVLAAHFLLHSFVAHCKMLRISNDQNAKKLWAA